MHEKNTDVSDDRAKVASSKIRDKVWGDSAQGPVRSEAVEGGNGAWVRDTARDPWGGPPVQDVGNLPDGEGAGEGFDAGDGESPIEKETGAYAGVVGIDDWKGTD